MSRIYVINAEKSNTEDFILAIVLVDGDTVTPWYIRRPFQREPDFGVTSVNYNVEELLARAEQPS
jgi:hypothetical protein